MKTFKEFQKNSGKLVAGYASIGHYRSIDIPEHPDNLDNIPVGYLNLKKPQKNLVLFATMIHIL